MEYFEITCDKKDSCTGTWFTDEFVFDWYASAVYD